jgi:hypothetical protein
MEYRKSAFDHGITKEQIDQMLAADATVWATLPRSRDGYERAMVIGFDSEGRLLEVGIELTDNGSIVFHAMKATRESKQWFEEKF